jgi:hypothetical protein
VGVNHRCFNIAAAQQLYAVERLFQDLVVQEQNRGQCLVLRGRRHMFFDGLMGQEAVDMFLRKLPRMTLPVELDDATDPVNVGLFSTAAVAANAKNFYCAVVEPGRGPVGKQAQG